MAKNARKKNKKKEKDWICGREWSSIFITATDKSYSLGGHRCFCMLRNVGLANIKWKELSSIIPSTRARRKQSGTFFFRSKGVSQVQWGPRSMGY